MAQNHVWRYTLRLFHTFAIFEKGRKMEPKREAECHHFSSKSRPWAKQGRLIHSLCLIFEGSKNRRFFDVDLGGRKIVKNLPLGAEGLILPLRLVAEVIILVIWGPRAAANYQEYR